MLESDVVRLGAEPPDSLNDGEREALAQVYLDATSGILHFCGEAELLRSLDNVDSPHNPLGAASVYLILAIGAQCRGTAPKDLLQSSEFFSQGQIASFQGMLCDPSLEMVRNFLLMAFYMLGACHRNAAFMYLGVASKAACALGLHLSDQYRDLTAEESRAK
ncbi:hypothetical protein LTR37_000389 [Vermiconidia calcicola]|uniref:Uncharacterized protein n=1 Tax=Vermiconidia calcicola TaxID=1690605 RepID=A0ACC3P087_9PEZI|nr:hypothetical protein LTR37_000389 [Vermiconidia calcicola]